MAADAGRRVTNIELEAKGQLATNNRPGDVAGIDNGKAFAVGVKDSGVLFFTFGMDAEGRLGSQAEETIRHFTNLLQGVQVKHDIFRRYWTRRIVVGFLAR